MAELPKPTFSVVLLLFQILLLGLYAGYAEYAKPGPLPVNNIYPQFQDVHVMMFFGFGFLMTFLKRYGYGALTYNFLLSAVTIQWSMLLNAWVRQRIEKEDKHPDMDANTVEISISSLGFFDWAKRRIDNETEKITTGYIDVNKVEIGIGSLMTSDFTAAAILISFGAVLGKASRLQLLVIAIIECIFFAINESIIMEFLHISDVGGSIVVHLFGAYFGLAVAFVLRNSGDEHPNESSTKTSDVFSMAGTIFLWIYWPSFNSGGLTAEPERQTRAIVNTYLALASCVVTTLVVSPLVDKKYRSNMVHIQNATLAGGVAVGTAADLMIDPWGAILIGMIAAAVSVLGYAYITPFMSSKLKIHDTCGVHNLHGMPAVMAAIIAAIAAASIDLDNYSDPSAIYSEIGSRTKVEQGGYQMAAAGVAFAFAIVGGLFTGIIVKPLGGIDDDSDLYNDVREFEVPDDVEPNVIEIQQMKETPTV